MTSSVDTFTSKDVKELLFDKYILILGDSVMRGLYKDLIKFCNSDELISEEELRIKGENRFYGDQLIHGGIQKGLTNGTNYEEIREYIAGGRLRIRFYFLTRCYSSYMKDVIFKDIKNQAIKPDIIIMNSCVWDISRYGIYSMRSYQQNTDRTMSSFRQMFPDVLFIWLSALPVSNSSKGGVIVSSAEYVRPILPGLLRDGNYYCSKLCDIHDVLYIDFHTIFSTMLHLRRPDGIHWCAVGNRLMNEIILNHIKAYYHGVTHFKCPLLRAELGHKINTFRQRMKKHVNHSKTNSLERNICNEDDENYIKNNKSSKSKRKRNDNNDDEKENDRYQRKVIIKSTINEKNSRTVILKESIDESKIKRQKSLEKQPIKFDHDYCDIMYDNEFEGLHLSHFSSYDIDSTEEIEDFQLLNGITRIKNESTNDHVLEVDLKSSKNSLTSVPLSIQFDEKPKIHEPDYIVLSSDDENETEPYNIPSISSSTILPIYLLNRLS